MHFNFFFFFNTLHCFITQLHQADDVFMFSAVQGQLWQL